MARYAINEEGVIALRKLASDIQRVQADMETGTGILWNEVQGMGNLGVYADEILRLLDENRRILARAGEDILVLSSGAKGLAGKVEAYMQKGIVGGCAGHGGNTSQNVDRKQKTDCCGMAAVLKPVRSSPRNLLATQFGYHEDTEGNLVYDTPEKMDGYLYKKQGKANIFFAGTCGLCSCANIMRLAGVNASEKDMIDYASKTHAANSTEMLCEVGNIDPRSNGATSPMDRKEILEHFGVESDLFDVELDETGKPSDKNITNIAGYVALGRGVILSVHAKMLWYNAPYGMNDYHAVTVISVKKDKNGSVLGFYICDSKNGGTQFYQADKVNAALTGAKMNVTRSIIR